MDRPSCTGVHLTAEETAGLQELADTLGITPELAAERATRAALDAQYLLPARKPRGKSGVVRPIRPGGGPESWRRT